MADLILKKHPIVRAAHYLFLLPFGAALWPLIINFRALDFIIYSVSFALILFLVVYCNRRPSLASDKRGLHLYLHNGREIEFHPFDHIISYYPISKRRVYIALKNDLPITLFLKPNDLKRLIDFLDIESINLHEIEAARQIQSNEQKAHGGIRN